MKRPVWSWFAPSCFPVWSWCFRVVPLCFGTFSLCLSFLRATSQEPILSNLSPRVSCSSSQTDGRDVGPNARAPTQEPVFFRYPLAHVGLVVLCRDLPLTAIVLAFGLKDDGIILCIFANGAFCGDSQSRRSCPSSSCFAPP